MSTHLRDRIADALRQRVAVGLQRGALRPGDRLPTTRELAADLDADARVVAAAYRALADEGLVEIRARAGVYVAALPGDAALPGTPPAAWLAEVLAQGIARGVAVPTLGAWVTRATTAKPATAAAIAGTLDQAMGLARELHDDFGIAAQGVLAETLRPGERLPRAVERANLLVATELTAPMARKLADRLGKRHVVIDVRPDLLSPEWRLLLARAAYVVIADPRFGALVHALLADADGATNVRLLVAGRDSLSEVPPEAPTYVTEAARERLGRTGLPGRVLPPARTLSLESTLAIARVLVERNLAAG
ncbi:GntR family transcriptional regulator [Roseisolibacter sp. H3M3-2]|uniref:GntR family transcriptional regulator n=1 Tax=Roseisolibacter sp. H3M3-2 TaxID=3031323 RepID=UPI0023DC6BAA|nr:GntR family transcriptional regulator [Roseisolibacter sp. H3M3-2]MDF1503002.1 GntR family transcriptional regulator [Roseisolibacter sp. H3M3-2]